MNTPPAKRQCTTPPGVSRRQNIVDADPIVVGRRKRNIASEIFSSQIKGRREIVINTVDLTKYTLIKERVYNMLDSFKIEASPTSLWRLIIVIGVLDIFTTSHDSETFVDLSAKLVASADITYSIDLNRLYRLHEYHQSKNRCIVAKKVLSRYIQKNTEVCSHTAMVLAEIFMSYLRPRACVHLDALY